MYLPGKVLQSGTASDPSFVRSRRSTTTAVLDMTQASPAWRQTAPMAYPRAYNNLTILPDGSVLAVGGGTDTSGDRHRDVGARGRAAGRRSPRRGRRWRAERWARLYHSTSAAAAGRPRARRRRRRLFHGATNQTQAEYYSPPYLFKGARPTITGAPARRRLRQRVLRRTRRTARASRRSRSSAPAPPTHAFDENQRYVPLTFSQTSRRPDGAGAGEREPRAARTLHAVHREHRAACRRSRRSCDSRRRTRTRCRRRRPRPWSATGGIGSVALTWTAVDRQPRRRRLQRASLDGRRLHAERREPDRAADRHELHRHAAWRPGTYYYRVIARDVGRQSQSRRRTRRARR